jgi:pimeloyl-ACP methyl ester carboxylesterase
MAPTAPDVDHLRLAVGPLTFDAVAAGPDDGEPVLLLHGFPQSSSCWRRVLPHLAAAGFRAVAPDQRGYSPDARPTETDQYGIDHLVADAIGLADALGWGTFHLVGHDWGGAVAWQVAGRHGERLRSLSVVSTPHPAAFTKAKRGGPSADGDDQVERSSYIATFRDPATPAMVMADDRAFLRLMIEGSGMDAESQAEVLARIRTLDDADAVLAWYRAADPADADGMGPVTVPTLYVWSTDDIALGRTAAELTGTEVDGPYRFEVLDGVSHWVPEEAPDALASLLVAHIGASPST